MGGGGDASETKKRKGGGGGVYGAFADDENANGMGGDFVLAQKVGHKGGDIQTSYKSTAFPDDFIWRLRQVELPPRPAPNNRRSREGILRGRIAA